MQKSNSNQQQLPRQPLLLRAAGPLLSLLLASLAFFVWKDTSTALPRQITCTLWNSLATGVQINSSFDALIVLGFTLQPSPDHWVPTPILEDRLRLGLSLYHRNITKTLILSGGWGTKKNQAEAMRSWLQQQPGSDRNDWNIILEGRSNTTFQNAQFSFEIIKKRQFKTILIVTSSFHQFRSEKIFQKMITDDPQLGHIQITVAEMDIKETGLEPLSGFYHWVREIGAIALYKATSKI